MNWGILWFWLVSRECMKTIMTSKVQLCSKQRWSQESRRKIEDFKFKHLLPKLGIVKFAFNKQLVMRNIREHEKKETLKRNQNAFVAQILFAKKILQKESTFVLVVWTNRFPKMCRNSSLSFYLKRQLKGRNDCERNFCGIIFCGIYFCDLQPQL